MNSRQLGEYEIKDELWFVETAHDFTHIEINYSKAHATISTSKLLLSGKRI